MSVSYTTRGKLIEKAPLPKGPKFQDLRGCTFGRLYVRLTLADVKQRKLNIIGDAAVHAATR